ncbi:MAG: hypothetical protein RLZZ171_872 [Cyanobacteriota bacterium]
MTVDKKCLTALKCGVKSWNKWRTRNRYLQLDLRGINLSSEILLRINLTGEDLAGATRIQFTCSRERKFCYS